MTAARARRPNAPARFLELPADPILAFRLRAKADRAALRRLAKRLRGTATARPMVVDLVELEALAHGLAGAGGVFGYPRISRAASRLERLAERHRRAKTAIVAPEQAARLAAASEALIVQLDGARRSGSRPFGA